MKSDMPVIDLDKKLAKITSSGSSFFIKLFILASILVIFFGIYIVAQGHKSSKWPSVPGKIISSKTIGSGKYQKPKITYQYTVRKQTYWGDAIYAGASHISMASSARKLVREYPVGKRVRVYFDPGNPQNSALKNGVSLDAVLLLGAGTIFFVLGVIFHRKTQVSEELDFTRISQGFEPVRPTVEGTYGVFDKKPPLPKTTTKKIKLMWNLFSLLLVLVISVFFFRPFFFSGKKTVSSPNKTTSRHKVSKTKASPPASKRVSDEKKQYKVAKEFYFRGISYLRRKDYKEAEKTFRAVLATLDNIGGTSLPSYPTVQNSLAYSLYNQGNLSEAEKLYKHSISILEREGKPQELAIGIACEGLARIYLKEGKLNEIEPLYQRAIAIWDKVRGKDNGNSLSIKSRYASLLDKLGRHEEATKMRDEVKVARMKWRKKHNIPFRDTKSKK